ncbi:MAG: transcriptional repressor [Clostridiales bacterium]|nr:transcriptional repressor [Clostridiales bacterium]
MQKEIIIQKLRDRGCRITKQRKLILDIILNEDCSCCKEIYYKVLEADEKIGSATVYRMINTLEEIRAISRRNMYRVSCDTPCATEDKCLIELDDDETCHLSDENWQDVMQAGLKACGYIKDQKIKNIYVRSCEKLECV